MLTLKLAHEGQVDSLLGLRDAAAQWLTSVGVRQWAPGEVPVGEIASQVRQRQWWVLEEGDRLRGAVRLLAEDPATWGDQSEAALYMHGLVIARDEVGAGLGVQLLRWVEAVASSRGARAVRLDCVESNHALRAYYRRQGYTEVGRATFPDPRWYPVVLLEKRLA